MFQKLVNHNDDLRKLVERGCAVAFDNHHLVVRDIPYLDKDRQLRWGAIVTKLEFINQEKVKQVDHQIFFAGDIPCGLDGKPIANLGGGVTQLTLSEACADIVVQRTFSNKLKNENGSLRDYIDFFEKIENYIVVISGPAMELHSANPYTFRVIKDVLSNSVFKFHDTLTSRAEIMDLSANFQNDVIAIIGAGGTGAYVLDFLVKTPVKEIRVFDGDSFYVHNAFRSPGKTEESEFGKSKVEVYRSRYDDFRHGLTFQQKYIDATSGDELNNVTFAFVCVDKGSSRNAIFDILISKKIPFIDVGMGLNRKMGSINGALRVTHFSSDEGLAVREKNLAPVTDNPDDIYKNNIQIGELNALNACLAVIKFKQLRGFYYDELRSYHLLFGVGDLKIAEESHTGEN